MSNPSRAVAQPKLTVAMIVRDAAPLVRETLASIERIADQIIVVDTGSTDPSREVARRAGAQVFDQPWTNDFSHARNSAMMHAQGQWILWLDAGERLLPQAADELRAFVENEASPANAYMMLVVVPADSANIAGEQAGRIRLIPNRPGLRFQGRVRETLRPSLEAAGLVIEGLPWRILRSERDNDPQVKLQKAQRDLKLMELEIRDHGQQPRQLIILGDALGNLGEHERAVSCYRTALQRCAPGSIEMREAYYGLLTSFDAQQSDREAQTALCLEAIEKFPLDAQLLCALGGYLESQGRIELAGRAYHLALEHGQVEPETWHVSEIREIAAICYSLLVQLQNDDGAAQHTLERALAFNPASARVRRHLIDLHVKHDRRREALAEFDKLPAETPHREALRSAIRGACQAGRQNWASALAYLQTAYTGGCRDAICLRWLAVSLVSTGDTAAALPILQEWQALEPRNTEVQNYLASLGVAPQKDKSGERQLRVDAAQPALRDHAAARVDSASEKPKITKL